MSMGKMFPYQLSVGLNYADKSWFNLSSQIGYIRKGGKDKIALWDEPGGMSNYTLQYKEGAGYLSVNTTFQLKKNIRRETYYIGAGPRVDFKLNTLENSIEDEDSFHAFNSRTVLYGLKCEAGFNYTINKILLGINFSYLPSFNKQIDTEYELYLRDRTFTLGIVVGYVLK